MGKKIHALRLYLGLSLQAFGESLGYTGRHISRFEKNVVEPDERVIQRICEVFHVEPSYFTGALSVEQSVRKNDDSLTGAAAQRLTSARLEKGLSMWELSRRSGISQPQISLLESGKYQLKRKAGEERAEALDVGVDWLITGDEGKKRNPADKKVIEWLWEHPEVREELWKKMDEEE